VRNVLPILFFFNLLTNSRDGLYQALVSTDTYTTEHNWKLINKVETAENRRHNAEKRYKINDDTSDDNVKQVYRRASDYSNSIFNPSRYIYL
jgi:hypothetical protein